MPIIAGNLLADPLAQSFISLEAADAYLKPERRAAWDFAHDSDREAALVRASRWLAATIAWKTELRATAAPAAAVAAVGAVAARLAVEALTTDLWAATDTRGQVQSESVGPISVSYFAPERAQAAGKIWPWLNPMLAGLTVSTNTSFLLRA